MGVFLILLLIQSRGLWVENLSLILLIMSVPSFDELEAAANAVIRSLKTMPELSNTKIAIIVGLSRWKYLRTFRTTKVSLSYSFIPDLAKLMD